jgi:threonine dehydratase
LDYIIAPIGGGGLMSGTLITANALSAKTRVIGAEPEGADDAYRSLKSGRIEPSINPKTIADGLLTSLGENTFEIINKYIYSIVRVSDESIARAMRLIWERMKIVVEPSSATALAVVLDSPDIFRSKQIGIILSGGNVDLSSLPWK